jgi:acetoin utilization deacetylase AcuC-like enzyme
LLHTAHASAEGSPRGCRVARVPLAMPVVSSDRCRLHDPAGEVFVGIRTPGAEAPERLDAILTALDGAETVEARPHPDEALLRVHERVLIDYLAGAWSQWNASGLPEDPGQDRVVPYVFPHGALTGSAVPTAPWARPGRFVYDTMTLIGPGTWEAARAAADSALTAAELVLEGAPTVYACVRPPGHHAGRETFGGSCYLNNSALAASALSARLGRVAVIDIDAHHGNGTQEVFRDRGDVLVGSVHVDPGAGWFPHFLGFASESDDANRNLPLAPHSGDEPWLDAVAELAEWGRRADALVVPLGVDAAAVDPESPLDVTPAGFREAGRILGALGLPTVLVQEGGYDPATLGPLVRETLEGFEEAR